MNLPKLQILSANITACRQVDGKTFHNQIRKLARAEMSLLQILSVKFMVCRQVNGKTFHNQTELSLLSLEKQIDLMRCFIVRWIQYVVCQC